MLDRDVELARPKPDIAADEPAASGIGIERQRAVANAIMAPMSSLK
jgi:hypothetical protein